MTALRSSPQVRAITAEFGRSGSWLAIVTLALWTYTSHPAALLAAAIFVTSFVLFGPRGRGPSGTVGVVLIVAAILAGFAAERQVDSALNGWDAYWDRRVAEVGELLSEELDRRQASGESASDALAARWTQGGGAVDARVVRELRARYGSSALALYDPSGELVAWDGTHRGKVPESVQRGDRRYFYRDLPLFGYLYVTARAEDGSVAAAAYLLRAALPEGLGADVGDLASRFRDETGEQVRITDDDPGIAEAVWDLRHLDNDEVLLSVVLERPDHRERVEALRARWAGGVSFLIFAAWLVLVLGGPSRPEVAAREAGSLLGLVALLPFDQLDPLRTLFDPSFFALPGPFPLTLGRLTLLSLAAFTVIAVLPKPRVRLAPWVVGVASGVLFPAALVWVHSGVGPTSLAGGRLDWLAYQLCVAAILGLVAGTMITLVRPGDGSRGLAAAGVALAVALGASAAAWVWLAGGSPEWIAVFWVGPVALSAAGARASGGWQHPVIAWSLAMVVGATASIPVTWGHRVEARLVQATERLESLMAPDMPDVEAALLAFGRIADSLDAAGAEDVSILYDGWRRSGLAQTGQPAWLQIHLRDGSPGEGLRVGVDAAEPEPLGLLLADGWASGGMRLERPDRHDARYILTAALSGDEIVSVVVPPFQEASNRSALGPLLQGASGSDLGPVTVLPLLEDDPFGGESVTRVRTRGGWQVATGLEFSDTRQFRAQYLVDLPSLPLAVARASLILAMNVILLLAFWLGGRALVRDPVRPEVRLTGLVISFRARVTLALFGFFALANALFGTVAYRTLAQASHRSAQVLAERVVEDAAGWYRAVAGQMDRLASQVGAELLEYRDGELYEGSVTELVELGLYEGWTPFDLYQTLVGREAVQGFTETSVGRWEYVTAYRRLPDGDILAAQVPLQAGSSALQTTDLIELLGFVVLLGGALSLGLAMMAGRALTRPIHALQVASESVGAGDLGLRLPAHRTDEFGAVFRAFNRMVSRVRRARRQLVRTSRRTQLIMDEAAVGMVALDPAGRVTLVNPRAEALLGTEVFVGRQLPADGELGGALTTWLSGYLEGSADEAYSDFQTGERRVRVRVRRLGSFGSRRGVVVAMDDVTDELRAERVLAWGEMARQVAHEVKNPLTPIKLSIQHVRRAWDDGRPDFGEILVRNADAMLSEIDRLAGIAQSFSRFGAPGGDQVVPLAPVSVSDVVGEVMALYGGSAGKVRFTQDIAHDLPQVVARNAELKEVLVNLLENSRLAGHDGTVVAIIARRGGEDQVVLSVVDDGAGIPEDVLPRIFEPQFSTRSTGTGLGLAIVQRVVRAWGGSVSVQSVLGEGTSVAVTLRAWPAEATGEAD